MDENINEFKNLLMDKSNDINDIINKRIIFGVPYIFKDSEDKYYDLKNVVSNFFNVNHRDVFMVGSSKLGFSLAPNKLWYSIDWSEEKESDIDIVIISNEVFNRYWKSILEYKDKLIPTKSKDNLFLEYFFKGWLRPDKFPYKYDGANEWFEFFKSISYKDAYGSRKVAAAIYKEDYYFMKYSRDNLNSIRNKLLNEGE